jgi:hypothetical protein
MNRNPFVLSVTTFAIALLGAGAALAQEATSDAWMQATMNKSRAQVHAELMQARKDGSIRATSLAYIEPFTPVAARATVHAEAVAALRSGEQAAMSSEAYAFVQPRSVATPILLATK